MDRQFATLMFRNANLSPETFINITLSLPTVAEKSAALRELWTH